MKKSQVWIETVIYTLIGLTLIGVTLAIVTPKINSARERSLIEQSIESLNVFDEKISDAIESGAGNVRVIHAFRMREGELFIEAENDEIYFVLDELAGVHSEFGEPIRFGRVSMTSEEKGKGSKVLLNISYAGKADLKYMDDDEKQQFPAAATPYSFLITNVPDVGEIPKINIEETTR